MGWHSKHQARPGQVSQEGTETTVEAGPDAMAYPGFIPQRYISPLMGPQHAEGGGASAVPNNTLRGTESHGVQVDSHVGPRDSHDAVGMTKEDDFLPQEMPEASDQNEYPPVKVEVVNRDPDEIITSYTTTVNIVPTAATQASGSATNTGITPIRILGQDPHRTRAYISVVSFTSGGMAANGVASQVVLMGDSNQPPVYGFPIGTTRIEVNTTNDLWLAGQNVADAGVVAVYVERTTNADRLYSVK